MIGLLLKLLIAHFIGDFVLQPNHWVTDKKLRKHKSRYLYLHILTHAIALFVLLEFNWSYWLGISMIVISHYLIDLFKLNVEKKFNHQYVFVFDQLLHFVVIGIVLNLYQPFKFNLETLYSEEILLFILALILLTSGSSIIMRLLMTKWSQNIESSSDSLPEAGKYIGMLERLFVFGFIILNQWPALGLLIAAKSVFRFSDLTKAKDRKLTEYILIGTLLSFGLAMVIGLGYKQVLIALK